MNSFNPSECEADLSALAAGAATWTARSPRELADLLEQLRDRTLEVADAWVADSAKGKGLQPDDPVVGEEWASGPWALLAGINGMLHTLRALQKGLDPLAGRTITTRPDGQVVVQVFPATFWDSLLLSGFHAEVWQQPEVKRDTLKDHVAVRFGAQPATPGVCLILGAGNINSIPPLDALTKLVTEGQVCLIKLNPINDYLLPHLRHIFAPIEALDAVRFVRGDGAAGAWLTTHDKVDTLHITGSGRTHDLIVFGPGAEGEANKAAGTPRNPRPMSSELGGVGPSIVVPGPWSDADFRFQAEHLVTQKLHNAGCNCIASQILVLPEGWDGTDRLLDEVRTVLGEVLGRPAYYTGAERRLDVFREAYPDAQSLHESPTFLLIEGLDPEADEPAFHEEAFGQAWGVVRLAASDPAAFLAAATAFANDKLEGTLGCQIMIHPTTERDHAAALAEAIAGLRYGTIGINAWCGVGFLLPNASWGAFPGHTLDDVQSGIGTVHNALMFDKPQKTVVRGPFQPFPRTLLRGIVHISPKPLWFVTHKKAAKAARLLTRFEATHNVALVPPLFLAALSG